MSCFEFIRITGFLKKYSKTEQACSKKLLAVYSFDRHNLITGNCGDIQKG